MKSGNLNFLEPSGPLQACNGTALPLPFTRKQSKCCAGDVRLFTLSDSSRFWSVRIRSVTSNILAQQRRRNGTETWRRRPCQCEHLRLVTRKKILMNVDDPRRNGNVTYSVNQPIALHNQVYPKKFPWSKPVRKCSQCLALIMYQLWCHPDEVCTFNVIMSRRDLVS